MAAAWAIGPNTARPASRRRSARPATSGASGPTTVRSIRSRRAKATRPSSVSAASGTHTAWRAMPGLPGAVKSAVTRGLWAIFQASACSRPPPPTISILIGAGPARPLALVGRLDELEVCARDPRPGAARVELEVALPVSDRLGAALDTHQRAGQVEVSVGVVGRDLERPAVVGDRLLGESPVLVEASEVVGGLTAARVVLERRAVRGLPLVVATEPVEQEPEVVPGGGVLRIDRDHPLVRLDRVLPARGVAVPLARALEPCLGLFERRRQGPHQPHRQGRARRLLEPALV